MATAQDIIEAALRKVHVLGAGSSLSSDEAQDALDLLNDMLSTWSAEGNLVYTETRETFSTTGAVSYTIGSGADFNTTRPLYIMSAFSTQGSIDSPIKQISGKEYDAHALKSQGGGPDEYYYDAGYSTGTIYFYPGTQGVDSVTFTSVKPLTSFTALTTSFAFPEEYKTALIYNLAEWIAPEYEREASQTVKKIAASSKKVVEAQNTRNNKIKSTVCVPGRGGSSGDIYGGFFK